MKMMTLLLLFCSFIEIAPISAKAESSKKKTIQKAGSLSLFFELSQVELAKIMLSTNCRHLASKECADAANLVQAHELKSNAVQKSLEQLSPQALDFDSENTHKFKSEADLLSQIQESKSKSPFVVYEHIGSPLFFLKFSSLALQEATLARIGIYIEGSGQLAKGEYPMAPAEGHDYRMLDLARFFNAAEAAKIQLNPMEEHLLKSLLKAGLLARHRDEGTRKYTLISANNAALVSIGSVNSAALSHELNHAVYFLDLKYQSQIRNLYDTQLTPDEKQIVDKVMSEREKNGLYNFSNNRELYLTEFAAFFRDPDELWKSYLKTEKYGKESVPIIASVAKKLKSLESGIGFYSIPKDSVSSPAKTGIQ